MLRDFGTVAVVYSVEVGPMDDANHHRVMTPLISRLPGLLTKPISGPLASCLPKSDND